MQQWEYRRIIIVNKHINRIQFHDSLKGRTDLNNMGFVRTPEHAARIANYLNEVGQEGWEIASHAVTANLADEVVMLRRAVTD